MKTRLDAVVRVREREEEKALLKVAEAEKVAKLAAERAHALKLATKTDHRRMADAATWEMLESAHTRALTDARKAEKDAERLAGEVTKVRLVYTSAHQRAEVVRRVAETRRDEQRRELERTEDKALDEVASLLWYRKAG